MGWPCTTIDGKTVEIINKVGDGEDILLLSRDGRTFKRSADDQLLIEEVEDDGENAMAPEPPPGADEPNLPTYDELEADEDAGESDEEPEALAPDFEENGLTEEAFGADLNGEDE